MTPGAHTGTIMVIDDEKDVRESVSELLATRGYEVLSLSGGIAALEHLQGGGKKPDLILLDLMMPAMNGWQFRDELSKHSDLAAIPVVVMTATRNLRQIQAEEVVFKPVRLDQLLGVVERWSQPLSTRGAPVAATLAAVPQPATLTPRVEVDRTALLSERFVEMLGHDLRNPLSAISMTGSLLSDQAKTPEIAGPTARILGIVDRMDLMIAHLLDFLRLCLGRELPLERRQLNLADVCKRVVKTLSPNSGREIEVVAMDELGGRWDRDRIEQLVSTLLSDAYDRDVSDGLIRVNVDGSRDDRVRLEVIHRGVMPVDLLSGVTLVNERGAQEECIRLGLGLYIARQIVLAHGGEMQVESDIARGTRFTVELPRDNTPGRVEAEAPPPS